MCNFILISCDSNIDLTQFNGHQLKLTQLQYDLKINPELEYLKYPNYWLLGATQSHGCACGFRHIEHFNNDLGFGPPESWCEEDEDDIEATVAFYSMVQTLLHQGIKIDSFDLFDNLKGKVDCLDHQNISLKQVPFNTFRFFEQVHFIYEP